MRSSQHPQASRSMICPLAKLGRSSPKADLNYDMSPTQGTKNSTDYGLRNGGDSYSIDMGRSRVDKYSSYGQEPFVEQGAAYFVHPKDVFVKNRHHEAYQMHELPGSPNFAMPGILYDNEYNRNLTGLANLSISNELYWNGIQNSQDSEQSENGQKEEYYQSQQKRMSSPLSSYMTDNYKKMAPFSPNCDQGYHTLLFSSPGSSSANVEFWNRNANLYKGKRAFPKGSVFDKLSDDMIMKIFSYLHSFDLASSAQVCRRFESIAWRPALWRTITFSGEQKRDDRDIRTDIRTILRQLCAQDQGHICHNIERVYISDGAKITDREIMFLARRCPELTYLQIHGCPAVTNSSIHELVTRCNNLHHLDLTGKLPSFILNMYCIKVLFTVTKL